MPTGYLRMFSIVAVFYGAKIGNFGNGSNECEKMGKRRFHESVKRCFETFRWFLHILGGKTLTNSPIQSPRIRLC